MSQILFGANVSTSAAPGDDPVGDARAAEAAGYDFVSASDHPSGTYPSFETWTLLAWIAAGTTRITVASRVLGVPYRSPAMVAKMAESLDRLSGGRLILGLGAGASDNELRAFGLPAMAAGVKISGLADAVAVIRGLWSEPAFTYRGQVHHTQAAPFEPKPATPIPIWLGTFGARALAITGQVADGWIPSLGYAPAGQLPGMLNLVLGAAQAAGRRRTDITCALNVQVRLDDQPGADPDVISGSAEQVSEQLLGFTAAGFTAFNFMPAGPRPREQLARLAAEVIPAVRALASPTGS
jgi:alkanesulfonate monooxygenase SsuD/methylene tetrahydromethanopterin reductase-like flavin-dependent oxidoreductase (luciferase family)